MIAGPGAGKTELLAQKAGFLLETNTCPAPRRILAISFKRDAADNLEDRVESRVGSELAARFNSHTFDSFAKGLLERFREGLPTQLRPPKDFEIITDFKGFSESDIRPRLKNAGYTLDPKWMLDKRMCSVPLSTFSAASIPNDLTAAKMLWLNLLKRQPCLLTFDMIKRLTEWILIKNSLIARALRITYSHVFLDEFQDTTAVQYDLLRTAFPLHSATVTAVGDNKQRIMLWANAMPNAFDIFTEDYGVKCTQLLLNRRSDKRLVEIQHHLIAAIDPSSQLPSPASNRMKGDGICEILEFENEAAESDTLLSIMRELLTNGVKPEEISILVRQTAPKYIHKLLDTFHDAGIALRLEEPYQILLKDELIQSLIGLLSLCAGLNIADHWLPILDLVYAIEGIYDAESKAAFRAETQLANFIKDMKPKMRQKIDTQSHLKTVVDDMLSFLGHARLQAYFPKVQNESSFNKLISDFISLLFESWSRKSTWKEALNAFLGHNTIPAMTIHKSKGLEYHTVFFIGLEDSAWWNFANQSNEETCAFFVAFSRAKKQAYFTFCHQRAIGRGQTRIPQRRKGVNSLYQMLLDAGVTVVSGHP